MIHRSVLVRAFALCLVSNFAMTRADADYKKLDEAIRGISHGFPFAGAAKGWGGDGAEGGYDCDPAPGASDYPATDAHPPKMVFGAHWKAVGGGKPRSAADLDKGFEAAKGGFPKDSKIGEFGQHSWMQSKFENGTNDPNFSGDPYIGYAVGGAFTECGSVTASVAISIWSEAAHGARNKPAVLEAVKKAAEGHLHNILGQLLAVMRFGCDGASGDPVPATSMLEAETECQSVTLVRGKLPSTPCGIYVRNWPANRGVSTCFPDLIDAWGSLPNGIVVTFRNEYFHPGAVIARGRREGEYFLPMWWYARCQAVPGVHTVDILVQEGEPSPTIGGCASATNRARVRVRVEVLEETSGNCNLRPNGGDSGGGGTGGATGGTGTGGGRGPAGPFVGRFRTTFGDLVLTDAGNGDVRGTFGNGTVVIGKVKDNEFIGTFTDASGDGLIHLISPDGKSLSGEWKRGRGPDAGRSGTIRGDADPSGPGTNSGTGSGTGTDGELPGGGGNGTGDAGQPGGPGTGTLTPLRPTPAPLQGLTLQAPELRVSPGQEFPVSVWILNARDVVNMNWELSFDPGVVSSSTSQGSVEKGNLLTEAFEANPAQAGLTRMGFAQKKALDGTGTVSVHRMKAVGAVGTRTPLTLAVTTITDSRPQRLPIALLHGFVEIVAPGTGTPGSLGGGPAVTVQDAYKALKMSVGLIPANMNVDMDRDGKVTSLDAYLIMTTVMLQLKAGK